MENLPLISVIIPVYNVEKYLEECIDSVISQTYKNIEIILVDDGSTDSSGEICDHYAKDYPIVSVIHKENGGQSTARNVGVGKANGKYVYFMDSDDILLSNAFEKLLALAKKNSADVVFFDAESFVDDGFDMKLKQSYVRKHKYPVQSGRKTFEQMQNLNEYHCVVWGMLLGKDFLLKNSIQFIPGMYYEDMVYAFEVMCLAETVVQCEDVLYRHRYRPNSTMTSKKSKKYFVSSKMLYENVRDFSLNHKIANETFAKKYIARNAFNVFNNFSKLSSQDKRVCRTELNIIRKDILKNNAYDDVALKMRCHSYILWFIYKAFEKTIGKLR